MAASSGDPLPSEDECIFGDDTDGFDAIIREHCDLIDGGGDSDSDVMVDSADSDVVADDDQEVQLPIAYICRHVQIMCVFA